jgi:uncharacterized protein YbjQ (UPF0145 family)
MIISTTGSLEGHQIREYKGIISAQSIIGANIIKDIFGGLTDFFGGRSTTYEKVIDEAKQIALKELEMEARKVGANAIVGVDLDFETIGGGGSMLMVIASGTAVVI